VDDYVPKGAVILRFRDTRQRAQLEQAEAALRASDVAFKDAEKEFTRIRDIYAKKLVAKAALDKASAALNASKARKEQAQARVREASDQLERTVLHAPYSGIVTARHVEVGETPRVGQKIITGLSLDKLRVVAQVPQQFVSVLRGDCCPARILLPGNEKHFVKANKLTVSPIASSESHSFQVRVDLEKGQHGLYPGMFVKLVLDTGKNKRLLVPARAIVQRSEVTGVYVLNKQAEVSFRHIRTGRAHGNNRVEVHAGLEEGERIALDPIAAGISLSERVNHE
ncbi:MAG: efflux RND transporter periplasmic adaptor subunit, partial [Gammaproteobacteria bacterium]|nr:efflux RND transporter periplasmic adaptor subunit [Gammaproteobacteria bacterium]